MLNALRKHSSSWVAQLLIGLLVLSFAVWGVSGFFTGFYADTVATVGKTAVSTSSFAREYDQALRSTSRQLGRPITADQAQLFGLPGQVLGRLVSQATLDDTAREYGLGISDEVLAQKIAEDPAFRGPSGRFERIYFEQVLRNAGYSENQYVRDQQSVFLRFQISNALVAGATTPEPYLHALHEYRSEQRGINYVLLAAADAGTVDDPSDIDLNAYFQENIGQWRAPEYRALILFEVTPADIAKPDEITDAQAQAAYDADIDQYSKPEQRRISQIHFDEADEANAAAAVIAAGNKSFDEIAKERNLSATDISLGLVTSRQIIDPKVADVAFSLANGTTSGAVEGNFGWKIVRVEEILPGEVQTFDSVRDEIKEKLALDLATRRIIQTFDEVEDSRAAGDTLAEIAARIGADLETVEAVDQSGKDALGKNIADLPGGTAVVNAAFESDVDIENDAVRTGDGGYVWYEVTSATVERDRNLDEVRDDVIAAWRKEQIDQRLTAKAGDIRNRVEAGETLDQVAGEMGFEVKTTDGLTRASQPPAGLSASAISAVFGGPQGHVAVTDGAANTGSKAVLVVKEVSVPFFNPEAPELAQARKQLSDQIANDYLQEFLVEKQKRLGFSVNQTALQSVVGQISPGL